MLLDGGIPSRLRCTVTADDRLEFALETASAGPLQQIYAHPYNRSYVLSLFDRMKALLQTETDLQELQALSRIVSKQLLPTALLPALAASGPFSLMASDQGFPWELLSLGEDFWGTRLPFGRTLAGKAPEHVGTQQDAAKQPRRALLIINPTGDLPHTEQESLSLIRLFEQHNIQADCLFREYATLTSVSLKLNTEAYEFIHYSGHIALSHGVSALALAEGETLTADAIERFSPGNALVFLNGCSSAAGSQDQALGGLVDAFAQCGASCIVGTLVDVQDEVAAQFAGQYYRRLMEARTASQAMRMAKRDVLQADPSAVGALAYALFGNPQTMFLPRRLAQALAHARLFRLMEVSRLSHAVLSLLKAAVECAAGPEVDLSHLLTVMLQSPEVPGMLAEKGYDIDAFTQGAPCMPDGATRLGADVVEALMDIDREGIPRDAQWRFLLDRACERLQTKGQLQRKLTHITPADVDDRVWHAFFLSMLLIPNQVISTYSFSLCLSMLPDSRFAAIVRECGGEVAPLPADAASMLVSLPVDALDNEVFSANLLCAIQKCRTGGVIQEDMLVRELLGNAQYSMHKVLPAFHVDMETLMRYYAIQ